MIMKSISLLYDDIDDDKEMSNASNNEEDELMHDRQEKSLSQPSSTTTAAALSDGVPKKHTLLLLVDEEEKNNDNYDHNLIYLDVLSQGENWLQLPSLLTNQGCRDSNKPRILSSLCASTNQETENQNDFWQQSYTEASNVDDNLVSCFLCLDVDGTYVAVKDMRTSSSDETDWTVSIARAGHQRGVGTTITNLVASKLEILPRRQLRILYHKDCIVVEQNQRSRKQQHKFVMQYHYDMEMQESPEQKKMNGPLVENEKRTSQEVYLTPTQSSIDNNNLDSTEQADASFQTQTEELNGTGHVKNSDFLLSQEIEEQRSQPKQDDLITPSLEDEDEKENKIAQHEQHSPSDSRIESNDHDLPTEIIFQTTKKDAAADVQTDTPILSSRTPQQNGVPADENNNHNSTNTANSVLARSTTGATDLLEEQKHEDNQPCTRLLTQPCQQKNIVPSDVVLQDDDSKHCDNSALDNDCVEEYTDDDDSTVDPDDPSETRNNEFDEVVACGMKTNRSLTRSINQVNEQGTKNESDLVGTKIEQVQCHNKGKADTEKVIETAVDNGKGELLAEVGEAECNEHTSTTTRGSIVDDSLHVLQMDQVEENVCTCNPATPPKDLKINKKDPVVGKDGDDEEELLSQCLLTPDATVGSTSSLKNQKNLPTDEVGGDSGVAIRITVDQSTSDNGDKQQELETEGIANEGITGTKNTLKEKESIDCLITDEKLLEERVPSAEYKEYDIHEPSNPVEPNGHTIDDATHKAVVQDMNEVHEYDDKKEGYSGVKEVAITMSEKEESPNHTADDAVLKEYESGLETMTADEGISFEENVKPQKTFSKNELEQEEMTSDGRALYVDEPSKIQDYDEKKTEIFSGENDELIATISDRLASRHSKVRRKRVVGSIPPPCYLDDEKSENEDLSIRCNSTNSNLSLRAIEGTPGPNEAEREQASTTPKRKLDSKKAETDPGSETVKNVVDTPSSPREVEKKPSKSRKLTHGGSEGEKGAIEASVTADTNHPVVRDPASLPHEKRRIRRKSNKDSSEVNSNSRFLSKLEEPVATPKDAGFVEKRTSRKRNASALETPGTVPKETENAHASSVKSRQRTTHTPNILEKRNEEGLSTKRIRQNPKLKENNEKVSEEEEIKVVVTGLELNPSQKKMLKNIHGILLENIEDAHKATHAIVTDGTTSIRRTPKLMIALCRTPNIVSLDWLTQSSTVGKALPCDRFLVLDDSKAEKLYNFSLARTIDKIQSNIKRGSCLLEGMSVFVCNGVAGNKAPPENELRLIVEAAGGLWLTSLKAPPKGVNMKDTLIITSDPEPKKQATCKDTAAALKKGATKKTTSWLFQAITTQELGL